MGRRRPGCVSTGLTAFAERSADRNTRDTRRPLGETGPYVRHKLWEHGNTEADEFDTPARNGPTADSEADLAATEPPANLTLDHLG